METPAAGIDVNPLTRQLQRRLQQRSVLYLMGPGRMLDRVRQVPGLLARLPRTTWDLLRQRRVAREDSENLPKDFDRRVPDFRAMLQDQFAVVQSRIDDAIRSSKLGEQWIDADGSSYAAAKLAATYGMLGFEMRGLRPKRLEKSLTRSWRTCAAGGRSDGTPPRATPRC